MLYVNFLGGVSSCVFGAVLVVTGLPLCAGAAPRESGSTTRMELERAIARWDVAEAKRLLGTLPDDPYGAGRVALLEGEYGEALRRFKEVPRRVHGGLDPGRMTALARDSLELSRHLTLRESEHFSLYFNRVKDGPLTERAVTVLEAAYRNAGAWLGWEPEEKIRVEIVPDEASFVRVSGLGREQIERAGAVGICRYNRIIILSPRVLARGYRWRDTLAHQYMHYLLIRLSAGRAPVWLQEGAARYGDTLWRSRESLWLGRIEESLLAEALGRNGLIPFRDLASPLVNLPSTAKVRLAFAQCALAVEYLLETWGISGLRDLLVEMSQEDRLPQEALQEVLGVDLAGFEERWRQYLGTRGFTVEEGLGVPAFVLRSDRDGGAAEDVPEDRHPRKARKHLKLGDMLRERQRFRAALKEYGKALELSPLSPYVLNRMGGVMLELGDEQGAESMFRRGMEIAPDYPASYANSAEVHALRGDWEEARMALEEYLDINPYNPVVWKDLGSVYMEIGEAGTALNYWETSLRLNPADAELRRVLGRP